MKQFLLSILLFVLASTVFGQQLPIFMAFQDYEGYINPAGINIDYYNYKKDSYLRLQASHRTQWIVPNANFTGHTSIASAELFNKGRRIGSIGTLFGADLMRDEIGPLSTNNLSLRAAGYVGNRNESFFGIGASFNTFYYEIDFENLFSAEPETTTEPPMVNRLKPNLGVGLYGSIHVNNNTTIRLGASMPRILNSHLNFIFSNTLDASFDEERHFYGNIGLIKKYGNRSTKNVLKINAWGRYVRSNPLSFSINVIFETNRYDKIPLWIGFGTNSAYTLSVFGGIITQNEIRIGIGATSNHLNTNIGNGVKPSFEISVGTTLYNLL